MNERSRLARDLARSPLFATSSRRDRRLAAIHAERLRLDGDHVVVARGEPCHVVHLVLDGRVLRHDPNGIRALQPGDYFDVPAVLTRSTAGATVVTDGPCELAVFGATTFRSLMRHLPDLCVAVATELARTRPLGTALTTAPTPAAAVRLTAIGGTR